MTFKKYIYDSEASHDFIKDGISQLTSMRISHF